MLEKLIISIQKDDSKGVSELLLTEEASKS